MGNGLAHSIFALSMLRAMAKAARDSELASEEAMASWICRPDPGRMGDRRSTF
jgi:hypothetical protein